MLDNTRLRAELTHIHGTLSGVAASPRGRRLLDDHRRGMGGTSAAILWQSLFADCLRVAHAAAAADGAIGDDEVDALYEFVFSAARHYAAALPTAYGEFAAVDHDTARSFLERYAADRGPFGRGAPQHWAGLELCRRAAELGESGAIERYERLMGWLIPATCQIGGVTPAHPRWRGRIDELEELRRTLSLGAVIDSPAADLRVQAFLSPVRVFASVAHASSVYESDPFDVESIHAEARASFEQLVERATTPAAHGDRGRMLLVLGDSGAGKTHLMRGFRRHVHEYGRGFVVYAQLHSSSDDYARYLLQHVVDSLARPYTGPSGERTGLHELASGLPRLIGPALQAQINRLTDETWDSQDTLAAYIERMVDGLLAQPELAGFDTDLLRVLLYGLYPQPATTARVFKYLRCEDMTIADRQRIGGVAPRMDKGDPAKMIRDLAKLAFATQHATLVLIVDQAELAGFDASSGIAFRRAVDTLQSIVSEVPSAIAVISCLSDLYSALRDQLTKSALDRLEQDPPVVQLQINRSYPEIEAIVSRRLSWLFADAGAVHRPETPVYPIPEDRLRALTHRRTRDVLEWCHQFQSQCAAVGHILGADATDGNAPPLPPVKPPVTRKTDMDRDLDRIAAAWNDAAHGSGIEVPDDDERILAIVGAAAQACADETGLELTTPPHKNGVLRLALAGGSGERADLAVAVTNRSYRGGGFVGQLEDLRKAARPAVPIAVRTVEFPRGPVCDRALGQFLKAGGRRAHVDVSTLRTLAAYQQFAPDFPAPRLAAWRRRDRPIASLRPVAELFDLDRLTAPAAVGSPAPGTLPIAIAVAARGPLPVPSTPALSSPPTTKPPTSQIPTTARSLHVGLTTGFQAEPRAIDLDALLRHTGVLGSPGSGKTTLALNLVEQVLERDIPVVLVDRKGDLAGYAQPDWWRAAADPERARRLAERLDVRLFTPGTHGGRPLSLSVIPDLEDVPAHERDALVKHAAAALAGMTQLRNTADDNARRAILGQALDVLADRRASGGLGALLGLLEDRDDALLARAGRYEDRLFKRLMQELETVRLSYADLLDPAAEPLTAVTLLARSPSGKVPLSIISTRFLGDVPRIQAWVAHLAACLARHVAQNPRSELQALFMLDEADLFMPATAKPPSKEPLQDLLKRARAGGLGLMLASQSPGDFDYRSREQINTWFVGRISERNSINKMKPLFETRPAVAGKLGALDPGRFILLQDGNAIDIERAPSLLRTDQLPEAALIALAAATRVA